MLPELFSTTLGADVLSHVLDKTIAGGDSFGLTMNTVTLLVGFPLFLLFMHAATKSIALGHESEGNERYITKGRLGQVIEVIVIGLRDQFIKPQLGDQTNRFLPLLLTLFFFILWFNLFGLVPLIDVQYLVGYIALGPENYDGLKYIGGTATGRLATNAALALVVFLVWNLHGIKSNGLGGWLHHFLGGAPLYLAPIMIPVEIIGAFVKPIALTIRLFANMTAGHVLLAAIIGFIGMALGGLGLLAGAPIALVAFIAAVLVFFLEVFVATLQAFVFMFLTAVFIAQMSHHEHDDHAHEHGEGDAIPEGAALGAA